MLNDNCWNDTSVGSERVAFEEVPIRGQKNRIWQKLRRVVCVAGMISWTLPAAAQTNYPSANYRSPPATISSGNTRIDRQQMQPTNAASSATGSTTLDRNKATPWLQRFIKPRSADRQASANNPRAVATTVARVPAGSPNASTVAQTSTQFSRQIGDQQATRKSVASSRVSAGASSTAGQATAARRGLQMPVPMNANRNPMNANRGPVPLSNSPAAEAYRSANQRYQSAQRAATRPSGGFQNSVSPAQRPLAQRPPNVSRVPVPQASRAFLEHAAQAEKLSNRGDSNATVLDQSESKTWDVVGQPTSDLASQATRQPYTRSGAPQVSKIKPPASVAIDAALNNSVKPDAQSVSVPAQLANVPLAESAARAEAHSRPRASRFRTAQYPAPSEPSTTQNKSGGEARTSYEPEKSETPKNDGLASQATSGQVTASESSERVAEAEIVESKQEPDANLAELDTGRPTVPTPSTGSDSLATTTDSADAEVKPQVDSKQPTAESGQASKTQVVDNSLPGKTTETSSADQAKQSDTNANGDGKLVEKTAQSPGDEASISGQVSNSNPLTSPASSGPASTTQAFDASTQASPTLPDLPEVPDLPDAATKTGGALPTQQVSNVGSPAVTLPSMQLGNQSLVPSRPPSEQPAASGNGSKVVETTAVPQSKLVNSKVVGSSPAVATAGQIKRLSSRMPRVSVDVLGPAQVPVASPTNYQVVVTNEDQFDLQGLILRLDTPTGISVRPGEPTIGALDAEQVEDGSRVLTWGFDRLLAGQTARAPIEVTSKSAADFSLGVEWTLMPIAQSAKVQVLAPKLEVAMEGDTDVAYGAVNSYRLRVRNVGDHVAQGLNVTIDAGEFGSSKASVGDLPAAGEEVVEVELQFKQRGKIQLSAIAEAENHPQTKSTVDVLVRQPSLVAQLNAPPVVYHGSQTGFTVTLRNVGDIAAEKLTAQLSLPAGASPSDLPYGARQEGQLLMWDIEELDASASMSFTFQLNLPTEGENVVLLSCRDQLGNSVSSKAATEVKAIPDLKLLVSDPVAPAPVGSEVTYELELTNRGSKAARNVIVVAQFSKGIEPTRGLGHGYRIVPGQLFFDPIAQVAAGETVKLKVHAIADSSGAHRFRAEVRSDEAQTRLVMEESTQFLQTHTQVANEAQKATLR